MQNARGPAAASRGWPLQAYFAAVGIVVVLAGVAAGGYVTVQSGSDARQAALADAAQAATQAAAQIDSGVKVIDGTSIPLVADQATMQALFASPGKCSLGYAPLGAFEAGRIELVRTDGAVICSSAKGDVGRSYAKQAWLQASSRTVVAPAADPLDGHPVAVFVYPVAGLGALAWFVDLASLGPKFGAEFGSAVNKLEFLVVSQDGRAIVSRSVEAARFTGKSLAGTPFAAASDPVDRPDVAGTPRWYRNATATTTGWKVYVGADRATALAGASRLQERELAIIAFGVLLTLLALAFVYRQVARPIAALGAAVRATRSFDAAVPVAGPAPVAALGEDINGLIASLQRESSDRESAERRYAELFEGNPLPSLILRSRSLEILEANEAAVKALGYSREEFRKLKTTDIVVPEDPAQDTQIQQTRQTEAPTLRYGPLNFRRKDGSFIRVVGTSYVVDYRRERVRVAMLEDVTEKEKIERQMQQAQRLESLGQLAGGVAHDFNNLLTVMLNVTASLKEEVSTADAAHDVERLDKAARSASRLTHQLLAFARRDVVPRTVLDVGRELAELKELLSRTLGSHVELVLEAAPDVSPVLMDRGQLEQIVINLAVNARDAMPRGGRLFISARNKLVDDAYAQARPGLAPRDYVEIEIADTGTGMDRTTLDRVFEPFFTTKPVGQGTGLGLATVYGIVKQVEGHVAIYSELGRGTTVSVLIPRANETVPEQKTEASTPPLRPAARSSWSRTTPICASSSRRSSPAPGTGYCPRRTARRRCGSRKNTRERSLSCSPTSSCPTCWAAILPASCNSVIPTCASCSCRATRSLSSARQRRCRRGRSCCRNRSWRRSCLRSWAKSWPPRRATRSRHDRRISRDRTHRRGQSGVGRAARRVRQGRGVRRDRLRHRRGGRRFAA
jgi:PAS domain S-box-containing protein